MSVWGLCGICAGLTGRRGARHALEGMHARGGMRWGTRPPATSKPPGHACAGGHALGGDMHWGGTPAGHLKTGAIPTRAAPRGAACMGLACEAVGARQRNSASCHAFSLPPHPHPSPPLPCHELDFTAGGDDEAAGAGTHNTVHLSTAPKATTTATHFPRPARPPTRSPPCPTHHVLIVQPIERKHRPPPTLPHPPRACRPASPRGGPRISPG